MAPRSLYVVRPSMATGGADRITLTLLEELDRDLFRPTLVLLRREGRLLDRVPEDVPVRSLRARSLWTAWLPLARLLRRCPPDVLFSTSSGANVAVALAALLAPRGPRLVLSERSILARRAKLKGVLMIGLKRLLYSRADCITAVSQGVKDDLVRRLRLAEERVRVVYNPVLTPELAQQAAAEPDHPWIGGSTPVVLAAGRLVAAKGFDRLLEAFGRIAGDRPARLVILGEGPLRAELEAQVAALGLGERVSLPGFALNPAAYMARCTLFVLSSRREGLPGALIQAMACGAPVVATDCPAGPGEIVTDGESGLLVPVDDVEALADGMRRLLADGELRAAMAARGRRAVARFAGDAVLPRYVDALTGEGAAS